jgi:hypothetical protein
MNSLEACRAATAFAVLSLGVMWFVFSARHYFGGDKPGDDSH